MNRPDGGANRAVLEAVAARIQPMLPDVVFVGGQVVELMVTDPAATRVRPTTDVDVVVTAGTRAEYHRIGERLRKLGFTNDQTDDAPICRWKSEEGHVLDLMPVDEEILGFSNEWYSAATDNPQSCELRKSLVILIPRPPIFLATKLAAFKNRGRDDLLLSSDLEDVIALVAGRPELVEELRNEAPEVKRWIAAEVSAILAHPDFAYALAGALPDAARMPKYRSEIQARFASIATAP